MVDDSETRGTRAAAGDPTADGGATSGYDATVLGKDATGPATIIPTWGPTEFASLPDPGYQIGELIGRGGMGEVVVAQDQRIGREVAVKRIRSRSPSPDLVTRFLREARIQARLDHPAIVPVYELGTDGDGRPYFTMKRLAGVTLGRRLVDGGPIQPLLRAFIDVCLAIQLAHSRGVVHRDLKPSNIMLGDYGEVYVLDWGVARVLTDRRRTTQPWMVAEEVDEGTTAGSILGTPGYMAPEQVRGHETGTAADVYALGAILFEILAGEALHPRGEAALETTLSQPQVAPALRASDRAIPPELDSVCFEALAENPSHRPSARQLADRVLSYLDGDRDLERRRALAAEQLTQARVALESNEPDARATATRRAGRALALDPESLEAAALVSSLILEPPAQLPPDLLASLDAEDLAFNAARSRTAMWSALVLFSLWGAIPFLKIKNWTLLIAFYGLLGVGVVLSWVVSRHGRSRLAATLVMLTALLLMFSRVSGPFILSPIVACTAAISLSAIPQLSARPWLLVSWVAAMVMLPLGLEWTHVLPSTYSVSHGYVLSSSDIFALESRLDETVLVIGNLVFIMVTAAVAATLSRRRRQAQRQLHVQAWHLRQLLPTQSRPWQTRPR